MKRLLSITCVAALLVLLVSGAFAQERVISGPNYFGCQDRDYYEKIVSYVAQKDKVAFNKALYSGFATGDCVMFRSGEPIFLTDVAIFHGLSKVRRKGDTQEYWTSMEAVGRTP
jgi:hypothetical protein